MSFQRILTTLSLGVAFAIGGWTIGWANDLSQTQTVLLALIAGLPMAIIGAAGLVKFKLEERPEPNLSPAESRKAWKAIGCLGSIVVVALLAVWMGPDREAETRRLASEVLIEDGALTQHHKNMLPLLVDAITKLTERCKCTPAEVITAGRTLQAHMRQKSPNTTLCQSIHYLADQFPAGVDSIDQAAHTLIEIDRRAN